MAHPILIYGWPLGLGSPPQRFSCFPSHQHLAPSRQALRKSWERRKIFILCICLQEAGGPCPSDPVPVTENTHTHLLTHLQVFAVCSFPNPPPHPLALLLHPLSSIRFLPFPACLASIPPWSPIWDFSGPAKHLAPFPHSALPFQVDLQLVNVQGCQRPSPLGQASS